MGLEHTLFSHMVTTLHALKWFLASIGVIIIVLGGIQSAWHFVQIWFFKKEKHKELSLDDIRRELGLSIVLGLEFILASDVILTIVLPDYYNLGLLAILVMIRTVLNYFIDKELVQLGARRQVSQS